MLCETSLFSLRDDGGEAKRFPLEATMMVLEIDP